MPNFISGILGLTIGVVAFASVLMVTIKSTNTTTWNTGEVALWGLIGLAGIAGMVYGVMNVFGMA